VNEALKKKRGCRVISINPLRERGTAAVSCEVPAGCAVSDFPEASPLFPIDHVAPGCGTPAQELLPISLAPSRQ
jgi:hypothetical protein